MKRMILISICQIGVFINFPAVTDSFAQTNVWSYTTSLPAPRTAASLTVADNKLFLIGGGTGTLIGTRDVKFYDPQTQQWDSVADLPAELVIQMSCNFNGDIYVFGGCPNGYADAVENIYMYDHQTGVWTQKAQMPYTNCAAAIAVVDSLIYLMGGTNGRTDPANSINGAYNPVTEEWTLLADLPSPREFASASVVDGKIYLIGGTTEDYSHVFLKEVQMFDPKTNTWTRKSDMPTGRWALTTSVIDGMIYAIGGREIYYSSTLNEMYNPTTDTWITKAPMSDRRNASSAGVINKKIYVAGGHGYPSMEALSSVEVYTPDIAVSNEENNPLSLPDRILLLQNFPNPFNPNTKIKYSIPKASLIQIKVFDVLGLEIETLIYEEKPAGNYELTWNAAELPSGVYFYQLRAGDVVQTKKMILMK